MCVSTSGKAEFSNTFGYIGESVRNGKVGRLLGYGNNAQNLKKDGPNAMWLHIPSKERMTQDNLIYDVPREVAQAMRDTIEPVSLATSFGTRGAKAVVVKYDVYHVVLAAGPDDVRRVLHKVPEHKRPTITDEMVQFYRQNFPGWGVALFCFNNRDMQESRPVWLWYEPFDSMSDLLHFPGIDAHTGGLPDLSADVEVDHHLFAGSNRSNLSATVPVMYPEMPEKVRHLLPDQVTGTRYWGKMPNGDWVGPVHDVLEYGMDYNFERKKPAEIA
ncbi:hypothetical protein KBC79_05950 [Candidatus Woesebacteria bacterium]|nr:hypothetical protein [Candidatus Woesebacteria bacterium]